MLEEMENIKYGNLETAMYYCERNKIGEWINRNLWRIEINECDNSRIGKLFT